MKRIFAVVLACLLLCGVMALTASAATDKHSVLVINGNFNSGVGCVASASYAAGEIVTIRFQPPITGRTGGRLIQWRAEPSVAFVEGTGETDAIAKFIMPNQDVSIRAEYETVWWEFPAPSSTRFWDNWSSALQWILEYILFGWLWMRWF